MLTSGEDIKFAAFREAKEELGLRSSNFKSEPFHVLTKVITGLDAIYPLCVYAVEVDNKMDFDIPHYETGMTLWLLAEEYRNIGRTNQLDFINALSNILE